MYFSIHIVFTSAIYINRTAEEKMSSKKTSGKIGFIPDKISRDQASGTGMAFVLILLLAGLINQTTVFNKIAVVSLVLNMVWPWVFHPVAKVWFGISNVLGAIVPRLLLGAVFYLVVTPMSIVPRAMGKDPLKLRQWKRETSSIYTDRNRRFTADDINRPF